MTIKQIMDKYNCNRNDAINILTKLNTPEELGLKEVKKVKSHQEKVEAKIEKK